MLLGKLGKSDNEAIVGFFLVRVMILISSGSFSFPPKGNWLCLIYMMGR